MATKSENADIAVLQAEMKSVKETLLRIEGKLDLQSTAYVNRSEFESYKKSQNVQKFFIAIVAIIIGALVTFFFTNVGKP